MSHESEWNAVRRHPSSKTSRLQREPSRGWHQSIGSHESVMKSIGHEAAPTFFWDGKGRQGESKTPLIA
jgi:hypothetical protein